MNEKQKKLFNLLTDSTGKGQSSIKANWMSFLHLFDYFTINELNENKEIFIEFLKLRISGQLFVNQILGEEKFIDYNRIFVGEKKEFLLEIITPALEKIPPKALMNLILKINKLDDNIFGCDFITNATSSSQKLKKKIMEIKLKG